MGRLEAVALREVWQHEALDFTPWLLANADALGEALEMDLEITASEHPVGAFSLDLIGRDVVTGERVIIENQLEATDHSHLGQLLTYAAGTDAATIVWVAREVRDEHRAALDWLNSRTDADTRFFGVEVTAVRIGDSLPAPLFKVVALPNDWGKKLRTRTQAAEEGALSEREALYSEFWSGYLDALRESALSWSRARKAPRSNWFSTSGGLAGVELNVSFSRHGLLSEVYLGHSDPDLNTARLDHLLAHREALESHYGGPLTFEPLDGKVASRAGERRPGSIDDRSQWPEYIGWFIDRQTRLRAALTAIGGFQDGSAGR